MRVCVVRSLSASKLRLVVSPKNLKKRSDNRRSAFGRSRAALLAQLILFGISVEALATWLRAEFVGLSAAFEIEARGQKLFHLLAPIHHAGAAVFGEFLRRGEFDGHSGW